MWLAVVSFGTAMGTFNEGKVEWYGVLPELLDLLDLTGELVGESLLEGL